MHKIKTVLIALVILGVGMVAVGVIVSSHYVPVTNNYPSSHQLAYPYRYFGQQLVSFGIIILLSGFLTLLFDVLSRFLLHLARDLKA